MVTHVGLGDRPGQGGHAVVHRLREGQRVDVVLQQQHLRLGVAVPDRAQRLDVVPVVAEDSLLQFECNSMMGYIQFEHTMVKQSAKEHLIEKKKSINASNKELVE